MESEYDWIRKRYGFDIPSDYREFRKAGLLAAGPFEPISATGPGGLFLSDLEWMDLEDILSFEPLEFQIPGLVPFAHTARQDLYCWYPSQAASVVFCPRDSEMAEFFSPSFSGFLYRIFLEELSGTWLDEQLHLDVVDVGRLFVAYSSLLGPFLPSSWGETLARLSRLDVKAQSSGSLGVMEPAQAEKQARMDLAFERFGEEFRHYLPTNR